MAGSPIAFRFPDVDLDLELPLEEKDRLGPGSFFAAATVCAAFPDADDSSVVAGKVGSGSGCNPFSEIKTQVQPAFRACQTEPRTFPPLILRFPLRQMLSVSQNHYLWLLIPIILILAPGVVLGPLRDRRPLGYRGSSRPIVIVRLAVFLVVLIVLGFVRDTSRAVFEFLEKRGDVLGVREL